MRLGIHCVQDLLFHLPLRYQNRIRVYAIRELTPGDHVVVEGMIEDVMLPVVGRTRALIRIKDHTGFLNLRFFHLHASQKKQLQTGILIHCFGEVRLGPRGLEMVHPEYRLGKTDQMLPREDKLTPIYPITEGVSQMTLRKLTASALQLLAQGGVLKDILPPELLSKFQFPALKEALEYIHRPPADAEVNHLLEGSHASQRRLMFEELLAHRLCLLNIKNNFQLHRAHRLPPTGQLTQSFIQRLSFELTAAQKRVIEEITQDLLKPHPMLRLVQGDVGSGKTVVAALAMLQAVENGYQAALLAPTELLAEQHFAACQKWFEPLGIKTARLSGGMKISAKREALTAIAEHQAQVVIGTHAIFQKGVQFAKLALIIVDEQHRFGVEQRAMLRQKGIYENHYPHQLMMTATPIPRTLAMSIYADLDYSVIDELPPGRTPIATAVIASSRRDEVLARIQEGCRAGRQAYWICTLIFESDVLQCQAAENTAAELKAALPELRIGLIHGQMKAAEKEAVMAGFKQGEIDLLVATTVIEVGVDVPNASLMVIENAERLGLAQLHQLRGRLGGAVSRVIVC